MLTKHGTYVSADPLDRAEAQDLGYHAIHDHPNEVGILGPLDLLVIGFDHVLFDDRDQAVLQASEAVRRGALVGVHTYYPDDPRLAILRRSADVVVAKTHRRLLASLRRRLCERGQKDEVQYVRDPAA